MFRSLANIIFILCLTAWTLLAVLLSITFFEDGPGGILPKLIHVAGSTGQLAGQSGSLVVWRLAGLFVITLIAFFARRPRYSKISTKSSPAPQRR